VHFGSLDLIITTEGDSVWAIVPTQLPSPTSLDAIVEALGELQLSALGAYALEHDQLLDFDFRRLEHQLAVYLGPHPS
jgi:hypothetical protein